jgi:hypothetical protein
MVVAVNKFTSAGTVIAEQDLVLATALPMPDPARSRSIIALIINDPEVFVVEDPMQAKETTSFALYFQQIYLRVINPDASGKQLLELNFSSTEVVKCLLNMQVSTIFVHRVQNKEITKFLSDPRTSEQQQFIVLDQDHNAHFSR